MDRHWHDYAIDPAVYMQLEDLANVLSTMTLKLDFTFGSYIDPTNLRLTVNSLWEMTDERTQLSGYFTDIYLRAIGTLHLSNLRALEKIRQIKAYQRFPRFLQQLITLFEDFRLEEVIKKNRPGTINYFKDRKNYLTGYFYRALTNKPVNNPSLDELLCLIYLTLHANSPEQRFTSVQQKQHHLLEQIKPYIYHVFSVESTADVVQLALRIVERFIVLEIKDARETYFTWPILSWKESNFTERTLFDQLTRTDEVISEQQSLETEKENQYIDETFSTWHTETELKEGEQTFLRMELDEGLKTNIKGGTARETESGDQAFASVQGLSRSSEQKQYGVKRSLDLVDDRLLEAEQKITNSPDHLYVKPIWFKARKPTVKEQQMYDSYVDEINHYQLRLSRTIEKVMEYEQSIKRDQRHIGRLSKNLLPIVTEEFPRLFYKKDGESDLFDAVFTLMIDCSASMYDKMVDTKRGVVLFHEVLKHLKISHKIVGFWETTSVSDQKEWPNYFQVIHSFSDSLDEKNGAKIIQLQPEEDNRDGYSLRLVTEKMLLRNEKHKVLLVFSDGEPSAEQYEQNGIIDTQRAVYWARKQGVDVIGIFLTKDKHDPAAHHMMKQIYGKGRYVISNVEKLADYFLPILRRLILRII